MRKFLNKITPRIRRRLVVTFVLFWGPALVFIKLADDVRDKEAILYDLPILHFIQDLATENLTKVVRVLTHGGDMIFIAVSLLALGWYLFSKNRQRDLVAVIFSVGGAGLINLLLKVFFQRERPGFGTVLISETSFSFPSGHAMGSGALGVILVIMFWRSKLRWPVTIFSGLYVLLVGVSRVYLGVHYPSDVVAGWCVSASWVLAVYIALEHPASVKRVLKHFQLKRS